MKKRRCMACGQLLNPNPRVKSQKYCSERSCQKERKLRWQKRKRAEDPAYRANQLAAQKRWRDYRKRHSDCVRRNRELQRERNRLKRSKSEPIAKMDASQEQSGIISGHDQLVPFDAQMVAKMDAINVKIEVIPRC
ncbi:hypothetical protein ACFL2Q_06330 [Thermodesulfobacteriota bacterium]